MCDKTIRVVLADDHVRMRAGIRKLLETSEDIVVIGEAEDGVKALELVNEYHPDVLILDIEMPKMDGIQTAWELKQAGIEVPILALSAYNEREYIRGILNNGVAGYLTKDEAPDYLAQAVRMISREEETWLSPLVEANWREKRRGD